MKVKEIIAMAISLGHAKNLPLRRSTREGMLGRDLVGTLMGDA